MNSKIMYKNCCRKCGSTSLHTEHKGNNTGLYCDDCGAWIKWLGKDELRAFEYSEKNMDNHSAENAVIERLNKFLDGIDEAIDCVYETPTAEHDKIIYNNAYCFALENVQLRSKGLSMGKNSMILMNKIYSVEE